MTTGKSDCKSTAGCRTGRPFLVAAVLLLGAAAVIGMARYGGRDGDGGGDGGGDGRIASPAAGPSSVQPPAPLSEDVAARPMRAASDGDREPACVIPPFPEAVQVGTVRPGGSLVIQRCQAVEWAPYTTGSDPGASDVLSGIDRLSDDPRGEPKWDASRPIPWQIFAQGEYVGPHRPRHVPEYRLRVDDELDLVYRLTRIESSRPYELNVGDSIRVESFTDPTLTRELIIQPDGSITLHLLGQVRAARLTVDQLRALLEEQYAEYYKMPSITVTPLRVNTKLEDLRATVDSRSGFGGQQRRAKVTPEGTIQLPALGSIPAQGLTLDELKREIDARYAEMVDGIGVTPVLLQRAPRFVFVVGEVRQPGRYALEGPTTAMQSIAMAGGWNNGGNIRQIVVFRRAEDWRLIATRLDLRGALLGKRPGPADEVWIRDSDIVVVPKSSIMLATDLIELVFTRGVYGVVPFQGISLNFAKLSSI